ncbi:hypothetical protein FA13DRAFT_1730276 [Coprinellus micaceus]|uniref:Uncharacterized protein n=1 Tax=Coprinellus micaceus TaxID=71717 RepID=A0A4Y7TIG6_COPMI|nr:hypothetical protein FA13DRAFT_1730276 [Coprinellus micaceus]
MEGEDAQASYAPVDAQRRSLTPVLLPDVTPRMVASATFASTAHRLHRCIAAETRRSASSFGIRAHRSVSASLVALLYAPICRSSPSSSATLALLELFA